MNFREFRKYFNKKYPNPSERGYKFENYAKWFLENDPVYKELFKKIWNWNNWPKKWGRDDGIDLIGEDKDGNFWSIQSKFYDEDNYLTKKDIDSPAGITDILLIDAE